MPYMLTDYSFRYYAGPAGSRLREQEMIPLPFIIQNGKKQVAYLGGIE